jgi:hypothetical protein
LFRLTLSGSAYWQKSETYVTDLWLKIFMITPPQHYLNARPLTDVKQVEKMLGIGEEEKQRADRLPVS